MEFNAYKQSKGHQKYKIIFKNLNLNFSHFTKQLNKKGAVLALITIVIITGAGISLTYRHLLKTNQNAGQIDTNCKNKCTADKTTCVSNCYATQRLCSANAPIKPDFCESFDYNSCKNKCADKLRQCLNKCPMKYTYNECSDDWQCVEKRGAICKVHNQKGKWSCKNNKCVCQPISNPRVTTTPVPPISETPSTNSKACLNKKNGTKCTITQGEFTYSGTCYNKVCYDDRYTILVDNPADCAKYGGKASSPINGKYLCLGCQNKPILQDKNLNCKPPYCTGAKACVPPGTTSPGTDCIWYICDTKGSGLWVRTNSNCTQPAPKSSTNSLTSQPATSTPAPTQTPTPTSASTTPTPANTNATPTPTPTPFPEITVTRINSGQCNDSTGGYTALYTINISYPNNNDSTPNTVQATIKETLDSRIDPAWVNNITNAGQIDSSTKTITWTLTLNKGDFIQLQYKIDYPTQALENTYTNTATVKYGTDSLGYKTKEISDNTTASCANVNDTNNNSSTTTITSIPNTGILDNIAIIVGALSSVIIGLIIGL